MDLNRHAAYFAHSLLVQCMLRNIELCLFYRKMDKNKIPIRISYKDFDFLVKIEKLPHRGNFFLLYFHLKPPVQYS